MTLQKTLGSCGFAALFLVACGSHGSDGAAPSSTAAKATTGAAGKSASAAPSASASASPKAPALKKGELPRGPVLVVESPHQGDNVGESGIDVSLVMSATDDPQFAYLERDLGDKLTLRFVAWDRDAGKWKGPLTVDTITNAPHGSHAIEIARDKSSSGLGIVYRKSDKEVWLALSSDSGASWKNEKVATGASDLAGASLALGKGGQFIAFNDGDDVKVLSRFAATGDFKVDSAPTLADSGKSKGADLSIKVDSDGKPGVLYGLAPKDGYNTSIAFWRPGDPTAYKVSDSNKIQNDDMHATLAFVGLKPRAAFTLARGGGETSTMYFTSSEDGKEWAAPINVPNDGGQSMTGALGLAASDKALPRPEVEAIVAPVTGGNLTGTKCGDPKVARMNDQKTFSTCGPDTDASLGMQTSWSAAAFDEKGKLYVAFTNKSGSAKLPLGLFVWHD